RTIGRTFTGNNGAVYRPSTFLTLTLDSYGRVRDDGSPVDRNSYDYRRAAWDAVHFPALLDRFWQNLRRAEGWDVEDFGSIATQVRLAPPPPPAPTRAARALRHPRHHATRHAAPDRRRDLPQRVVAENGHRGLPGQRGAT